MADEKRIVIRADLSNLASAGKGAKSAGGGASDNFSQYSKVKQELGTVQARTEMLRDQRAKADVTREQKKAIAQEMQILSRKSRHLSEEEKHLKNAVHHQLKSGNLIRKAETAGGFAEASAGFFTGENPLGLIHKGVGSMQQSIERRMEKQKEEIGEGKRSGISTGLKVAGAGVAGFTLGSALLGTAREILAPEQGQYQAIKTGFRRNRMYNEVGGGYQGVLDFMQQAKEMSIGGGFSEEETASLFNRIPMLHGQNKRSLMGGKNYLGEFEQGGKIAGGFGLSSESFGRIAELAPFAKGVTSQSKLFSDVVRSGVNAGASTNMEAYLEQAVSVLESIKNNGSELSETQRKSSLDMVRAIEVTAGEGRSAKLMQQAGGAISGSLGTGSANEQNNIMAVMKGKGVNFYEARRLIQDQDQGAIDSIVQAEYARPGSEEQHKMNLESILGMGNRDVSRFRGASVYTAKEKSDRHEAMKTEKGREGVYAYENEIDKEMGNRTGSLVLADEKLNLEERGKAGLEGLGAYIKEKGFGSQGTEQQQKEREAIEKNGGYYIQGAKPIEIRNFIITDSGHPIKVKSEAKH